jgi:hypothetical protein
MTDDKHLATDVINCDDDFSMLDEEGLKAIAEAAKSIEMLKKR